MTTTRDASVMVGREYLETILQRANIVHDSRCRNDLHSSQADSVVCLPRDEYEELLLAKAQYENITRNLLGAGVTADSIEALSQGGPLPLQTSNAPKPPSCNKEEPNKGSAGPRPVPRAPVKSHESLEEPPDADVRKRFAQPDKRPDWVDPDPDGPDNSPSYSADTTLVPEPNIDGEKRPPYVRVCQRTILLWGLPEKTTYWDVTTIISGGVLVDIFLRATERLAYVSFLHEEDAVRFYEHTLVHNIYIKGKRVLTRWADRQFQLNTHVVGKVRIGATRNLVIHNCNAGITENTIRDDLEHIHNLAVIRVDFMGRRCHIKTNSVYNASFAKMCMISRAKYKGSKVEWDVDECERPIDVVPQAQPKQPKQPKAKPAPKAAVAMPNRFATLRLDDDDNIDSAEEADDEPGTPSGSLGVVSVSS
ncbi:hypothetical protein GGS23DRAFT_55538 [Durotheca rogersii]|uniref:uncharacterized protein n=1 Tax=Durotheca rogersii TaxID=419775 RepID=UPI00221F6340|nr:uncharacterized protein GGS23DRAFT_55538 [Durotheca rogersii]KAI5863156.1 hypothetical protein GGS23DRAFT_55538 [Durotheca rogersii]